MHCLWGLQQQGFNFELKGGTSLSKGFNIIERFSEDIDLQIHPAKNLAVKTGKNHDKPAHIKSRTEFFDNISNELEIGGLKFFREHSFDDLKKMRNAGIRGEYKSLFSEIAGLKNGLILELGFDQTTPYIPCDISSWAFNKASTMNLDIVDNRAKRVNCYSPGYTFVEKLQTISTKYRIQQSNDTMPVNFLRHYYDIYKLLEHDQILKFITTPEYSQHKEIRFRQSDEKDIGKNDAFTIPDFFVRNKYSEEFERKSSIYFKEQPTFNEILEKIAIYIDIL